MISGVVNSAHEAIISLEVSGPSGVRSLDAVIDTGFTDFLTLPPTLIEALALPSGGTTRVMLADELSSVARVFVGEVNWHNRATKIPVLEMAGVPLMGMALLQGSYLHIHVVEGGPVSIS